jgi:hypothetical protein
MKRGELAMRNHQIDSTACAVWKSGDSAVNARTINQQHVSPTPACGTLIEVLAGFLGNKEGEHHVFAQ